MQSSVNMMTCSNQPKRVAIKTTLFGKNEVRIPATNNSEMLVTCMGHAYHVKVVGTCVFVDSQSGSLFQEEGDTIVIIPEPLSRFSILSFILMMIHVMLEPDENVISGSPPPVSDPPGYSYTQSPPPPPPVYSPN